MSCGVYKWTCKKSKKVYIGSSVDLEKRYKAFITFTTPYAGDLINEERNRFPDKDYWDYEILELCTFHEREEKEMGYINGFLEKELLLNTRKYEIPEQPKRITKSDYLNWDDAMSLIINTYNDEKYRISLLIACGCFFGCKTYELLDLTWEQILNKHFIVFNKRRIEIDPFLQEHIKKCFASCSPCLLTDKCFVSQKKQIFSVQRINVILKECKIKYNIDIRNFSTVTFMKTYINKVLEDATDKTQTLGILGKYFNTVMLKKDFASKITHLNDIEVLSIKI